MGKNDKKKGGKSKGNGNRYSGNSGKSRHHQQVNIRTTRDIEEENTPGYKEESNDCDKMRIGLFMWEFGQNDPKRDSGSKLKRLGYAKLLSKLFC